MGGFVFFLIIVGLLFLAMKFSKGSTGLGFIIFFGGLISIMLIISWVTGKPFNLDPYPWWDAPETVTP